MVDKALCDDFEKNCSVANDFVEGYENPVSWHKKYDVRGDILTKDVLFDNMDMKSITLAQYGEREPPEFIKWRLFGYNLVICYENISKKKTDKALEAIKDMENILTSIGSDDPFLKSIRVALNHITYSMKGHIWHLCSMDTKKLEHFILAKNMNNTNKAGLYGVQTIFFYEYDLPYIHVAKECALKAIELNSSEPEWHFLMARVLTYWQRTCGNYFECSEQEIKASEKAVELGNKDHHKIHLVHIYHRMSKNIKRNGEFKQTILKAGLDLISEVMNNTNDLLLLKNCLLSLSKISLETDNRYNIDTSEVIKRLINKLESSDNAYVHGAIGNYYLFNQKDYQRANYHLKKSFDVKSFGCSIDYIFTLFKMNPESAPVEEMLLDLLKTFSHPVHREKIISQIISYLIFTKDDFIRALKYVPMLLNIKNVTCIYSLQTHRVKFHGHTKALNLIKYLSEELDAALKDPKLSHEHKKKVTEISSLFQPYKLYVSKLMEEKYMFGNDSKKNIYGRNDKPKNTNNETWPRKTNTADKTSVKTKNEENWRTLKPDSNPNPCIFSRNQQKDGKNYGSDNKSRYDF